MELINLQEKTTAEKGRIEIFWYENKKIELDRTLFHRMFIPLTAFDPGLGPDSESVETDIIFDWLNLNLRDPLNLDKLILKSHPADDAAITIELGGKHNPCYMNRMSFSKVDTYLYDIDCEMLVDFEFGKIGKKEIFKFKCQVELDPKIFK